MTSDVIRSFFTLLLILSSGGVLLSQEFSSDLPLVVIDSPEEIRNEPKTTAIMKIIWNGDGMLNRPGDPGNVYSGFIGIEIRGRYSASLPQKPYAFETRDEAGANLNVSLLGMPEENDWILQATYNDKSFLRNLLAFELFRKMGHYAPRSRFCELVLNGEYMGIYILTESIKVDDNRVDIANLRPDENEGDDLTGGYIFKTDYYDESDSWLSNYSPLNKPGGRVHFVYHDPRPRDLTSTQKSYLAGYVNSFEKVLYSTGYADPSSGYNAWLDVPTFVDYFIISELTRNVDAYKKSRFFNKDKDSNGGLIRSGPVWDYDWAWRDLQENCIHMNKTDGSGWAYKINECSAWPVPPSWEIRLMQDQNFVNAVHDKYFILRKNLLSTDEIFRIADSVALLLKPATLRHFEKWRILGINSGTPEQGEPPETWEGELQKLKSWIRTRLLWLDQNMPGKTSASKEYTPLCRIYPVPAGENLHFESDTIIRRIVVTGLSGNVVLDVRNSKYAAVIDISSIKPGIYVCRVFFAGEAVITRKIIVSR